MAYDKDPLAAREDAELNANNALIRIQEVGRKWADPTTLLDEIPPDLLQSDIREANRRIEVPDKVLATLPPRPVVAVLGNGWYWEHDMLSYCLALIAARLGLREIAKSYLEIARGEAEGNSLKRALERLRKQLRDDSDRMRMVKKPG